MGLQLESLSTSNKCSPTTHLTHWYLPSCVSIADFLPQTTPKEHSSRHACILF